MSSSSSSSKCKLRRCQGRNGCLCMKKAKVVQVHSWVTVDRKSGAVKATNINRNKVQRKPVSISKATNRSPSSTLSKSKKKIKKNLQATNVSTTSPLSSVASSSSPPLSSVASSCPPPAPPQTSITSSAADSNPNPIQEGLVTIKYNHYNDKFPIKNGILRFQDIDDKYCFSYAFTEGKYELHLYANQKDLGIPEHRLKEDQIAKVFHNCIDGAVYFVQVEEDEEEYEKARQSYTQNPIKIISMAEANALTYGGKNISTGNDLSRPNQASKRITEELKGMKADELKGERYKQLLEARELEDCLYS